MNEKTQIYALAAVSVLVMLVFAGVAGAAVYTLFGIYASVGVGLLAAFLVWQILETADYTIKYRHNLYWEGVEIVNEKLLSQNPRNVVDAKELIDVLKSRIRDLDDARNEAVDAYNELKDSMEK